MPYNPHPTTTHKNCNIPTFPPFDLMKHKCWSLILRQRRLTINSFTYIIHTKSSLVQFHNWILLFVQLQREKPTCAAVLQNFQWFVLLYYWFFNRPLILPKNEQYLSTQAHKWISSNFPRQNTLLVCEEDTRVQHQRPHHILPKNMNTKTSKHFLVIISFV